MQRVWRMYCQVQIVWLVSVAALWAEPSHFPVTSYSGAKLASIRQWEQNWVGKKISHTDVESLKD